jgi:hypothetical protein
MQREGSQFLARKDAGFLAFSALMLVGSAACETARSIYD